MRTPPHLLPVLQIRIPIPKGSVRKGSEQTGLTLTEVIVAFGVFTVVLLATYQVFGGSMRATQYTARRLQALTVAQSILELVAVQPFQTLPPERVVLESHQRYPVIIPLHQRNIDPDSVHLWWEDGTPWEGGLEVDGRSGAVTLTSPPAKQRAGPPAGKPEVTQRTGMVWIGYRFQLVTDNSPISASEHGNRGKTPISTSEHGNRGESWQLPAGFRVTVSGAPVRLDDKALSGLKRLQVDVWSQRDPNVPTRSAGPRVNASRSEVARPVTLWLIRGG